MPTMVDIGMMWVGRS